MKWKLRKRIKQQNTFGYYDPRDIQIVVDLYSRYLRYLKESIREKIEEFSLIITKENVKKIIYEAEVKFNIFIKEKSTKKRSALTNDLNLFLNMLTKTLVKKKDINYNENFDKLTNFILKLLHKRLSFVHPNNFTFYEKIIRKEIIKWKKQEHLK